MLDETLLLLLDVHPHLRVTSATLQFAVLRLYQPGQSTNVSLRHQKRLNFGHFLVGVEIRYNFPQSLEGIIEPVHPLAFAGIRGIPAVSEDGRRGWVKVFLPTTSAFSAAACI